MKTIFFLFALSLSFLPPAFAEDSPEVVFQKFVEASRKGNVEEVIALSSAAKRKEAAEDMKSEKMSRETWVGMIKFMAPENYKILSKTTSPDQKKTSLFVEGLVNELFSFKGKTEKDGRRRRSSKKMVNGRSTNIVVNGRPLRRSER
jgi:hypothetical protein